jgi:type II secretory pathway predicted ATPase ExeA
MYEKFFGLRGKPFSLTPDPAFLYPAKRYQHALTLLEYVLVEGSGFALITGEVGCGKTTVVRHFLQRVQGNIKVALITNAHPGMGALLPWVVEALGLDAGQATPSELHRRFARHARSEYEEGNRIVLVIDEAQNLGVAGLEELRVLSNMNAGSELLLQTILVGQPELRTLLGRSDMRQFAQRIAIEHHLEALQLEETVGYIRHRIEVAGGSRELFAADALQLVHTCTRGIPRLINMVCDTALVYAFSDQRECVDRDIVEQVVQERTAGGLSQLEGAAKRSPRPFYAS